MAWADTRTVIRDVVLLVLGTLILVHELLLAPAERPLLLGAGLSCLGLPLVSGMNR
jgi:hypothetical protein